MVDFIFPVAKQGVQKILDQMNNSIFTVEGKDGNFEIGYFCYIKYQNKKVPAIIINNILLETEFNNTINIFVNNKKKSIELGKTRYNNYEKNISIIELKEDKIDDITFIETDDRLYQDEAEMFYSKESIYIIQFNNLNDISVSFGVLNNI